MEASLPALYQPGPSGAAFAARAAASRWSARLCQNLVVMNGAAAALMLGLVWAGVGVPFDGFAVGYLALFVLGLSSALLAMLNDLARLDHGPPFEQAGWLRGARTILERVGSFRLLFGALFCFVFGAACALIALSTAPAAGSSIPVPAAGPTPAALTRAAVGYWEGRLAEAMLAGDRAGFAESCASLTALDLRPGICDLGQ